MTHPKKSKCSTPTPDLDTPHLSAARADLIERMARQAAEEDEPAIIPGFREKMAQAREAWDAKYGHRNAL